MITASTASGKMAACKIVVKTKYAYQLEKNGKVRYLSSTAKVKKLCEKGWKCKKAFRVAGKSSKPVYQIYYKKSKYVRYTTNKNEAVVAKKAGNKAGIVFYASEASSVPVYEIYKGGKQPTYCYIISKSTVRAMRKKGWVYKGISWYAEPKALA